MKVFSASGALISEQTEQDSIAHGTNYRAMTLTDPAKEHAGSLQVTILDPNVNKEFEYHVPLKHW